MDKLHENRDKISNRNASQMQKEIVAYNKLLGNYKITFSDLTACCPKNANKRQDAKNIAKLISEKENLTAFLLEKKQIPVKELQKVFSVCHSTMNTYKKYIIALSLIYIGEFTCIKDYINH